MNSVAVVLAFLVGFVCASYVWGLTTQRVTYQHAVELWDLKCSNAPDVPSIMQELGFEMETSHGPKSGFDAHGLKTR